MWRTSRLLNVNMHSSEDCPIDYKPDHFYTLKEYEAFSDWLKTHDIIIDDIPIGQFERESDGRLVPMPLVPVAIAGPVGEIYGQLRKWNINTEQHGVPTGPQVGFNFGAGTIKVPNVAFTPCDIYSALDEQQRWTFQGAPFSPTFVVEVDNLSTASKLDTLTSKFKKTYFPAGVQLGWLIDPINKKIYTFMRESDGVVRRRPHQWYGNDGNPGVLKGGEVLPGFTLRLGKIDQLLSQVWSYFLLLQYSIGHRQNPPLVALVVVVVGSPALSVTRPLL